MTLAEFDQIREMIYSIPPTHLDIPAKFDELFKKEFAHKLVDDDVEAAYNQGYEDGQDAYENCRG
jgi:hypothetical protein